MRNRYNSQDYYQILGIEMVHPPTHIDMKLRGKARTAAEVPLDEIKVAHRKLIKEVHKVRTDAAKQGLTGDAYAQFTHAAEEKAKAINGAWDELKLPQKRAAYDSYHKDVFGKAASGARAGHAGSQHRAGPSGAGHASAEQTRAQQEARRAAQERARATEREAAAERARRAQERAEQEAAAHRAQAEAEEAIRAAKQAEADAAHSFKGRAKATGAAMREGFANAKASASERASRAWGKVVGFFERTPKPAAASSRAALSSFSSRAVEAAEHSGHGAALVTGAVIVGGLGVAAYLEEKNHKRDFTLDPQWVDRLRQQAQQTQQRS